MLVPEGLVAVGGIVVHQDLDFGEPLFAHFGIDFYVGQIALSDGNHGEGVAVEVNLHARKHQVGVELFRKPLSVHFFV